MWRGIQSLGQRDGESSRASSLRNGRRGRQQIGSGRVQPHAWSKGSVAGLAERASCPDVPQNAPAIRIPSRMCCKMTISPRLTAEDRAAMRDDPDLARVTSGLRETLPDRTSDPKHRPWRVESPRPPANGSCHARVRLHYRGRRICWWCPRSECERGCRSLGDAHRGRGTYGPLVDPHAGSPGCPLRPRGVRPSRSSSPDPTTRVVPSVRAATLAPPMDRCRALRARTRNTRWGT